MDELNDIKKLVKTGKLIIGTNNTLNKLKNNNLAKIWLSSNVPKDIKADISKYSKINNVEIIGLDMPNDELGILCKKQFSVSVASVVKGEK